MAGDGLGLDLCWEPPKLRLFDPAAGEWLLDPDDRVEAQHAAEDRARAAEDRAASAEAEVAELRRRLGRSDPPPGDTGR